MNVAVRSFHLGMALVLTLPASATLAQSAPATGRLTGLAWDSLARRPIAHAAVWSQTARRATTADASGHFVLDSLAPGEHQIVVADSTLDAVGFDITRRVTVAAGAATAQDPLVLATPSLRTIHRRICDAAAAGGVRSGDRSPGGGIVFGTVVDSSGERRLAGALVEVRWARVEQLAGTPVPLTATAHVSTDSLGEFAACDIPVDTALTLQAFGGSHGRSAGSAITLGVQRIARLDLIVARRGAMPPEAPAP